ncbi:hypothetical protein [Sessilibacter corallicola]|uniref:hypothetical protein n=1 Tax=Sessilibacter corallicola TaxID=2904075 RepID=UPI001E5A85BC|nr:hypothetical protein [Sessilibacter corallicola]MCE2029260.1 hypothetical protein [Sessilibacter corallicola]
MTTFIVLKIILIALMALLAIIFFCLAFKKDLRVGFSKMKVTPLGRALIFLNSVFLLTFLVWIWGV